MVIRGTDGGQETKPSFVRTTLQGEEPGVIDESQRKAGRVAGVMFLATFAVVVAVNFGINGRLLIAGNAAETARNILAHERLFRLGIAANLVYSAGLVVLLSALYVIFRPVSRGVALLAALWRLAFASAWVLLALHFFFALRLLNGADYLRPLGPDGAQALARFYLNGFDTYYVGLLFYGLASTACSWLWLKSRYIPPALASFGLIGSIWCVACTLLLYVVPDFPNLVNLWWFDSPMALFELVVGVWLLVKGLAEPRSAAAGA